MRGDHSRVVGDMYPGEPLPRPVPSAALIACDVPDAWVGAAREDVRGAVQRDCARATGERHGRAGGVLQGGPARQRDERAGAALRGGAGAGSGRGGVARLVILAGVGLRTVTAGSERPATDPGGDQGRGRGGRELDAAPADRDGDSAVPGTSAGSRPAPRPTTTPGGPGYARARPMGSAFAARVAGEFVRGGEFDAGVGLAAGVRGRRAHQRDGAAPRAGGGRRALRRLLRVGRGAGGVVGGVVV